MIVATRPRSGATFERSIIQEQTGQERRNRQASTSSCTSRANPPGSEQAGAQGRAQDRCTVWRRSFHCSADQPRLKSEFVRPWRLLALSTQASAPREAQDCRVKVAAEQWPPVEAAASSVVWLAARTSRARASPTNSRLRIWVATTIQLLVSAQVRDSHLRRCDGNHKKVDSV